MIPVYKAVGFGYQLNIVLRSEELYISMAVTGKVWESEIHKEM